MDTSCLQWGQEEFGHARLGHQSRNKRLIKMAARAAEAPAGHITAVYDAAAERTAAYRFVEQWQGFDFQDISNATARATATRCRGDDFVFCALDVSTLSIDDPNNIRGLGPIDDYVHSQRGLMMLNALATHPDGTPAGLGGQLWWSRGEHPRSTASRKRPFEQKESRYWLELADQVSQTFGDYAPDTRLWFQIDAAGDFRQMLAWASEQPFHWTTIRVAQKHRLVETTPDKTERYLYQRLKAQPIKAQFSLDIPQTQKHQARRADFVLRWCPINFVLRQRNTQKQVGEASFTAIWVHEVGSTPADEEPLSWWLVTTYPVEYTVDALMAVLGYSKRWRVEDFHRTWKTVCQVEQTKLRTREAILRWATILAAVAMRIERIKHLARTTPEAPADQEFSAEEVEAIILLRKPPGVAQKAMPTLEQAVIWLAQLGGYAQNPKRSPPGTTTIARGLQKISPVVELLQHFELTEKTDQ